MKRILCFLLSFVMIMSLTTSISASVNVNGVVSASVDEASPDSGLPQDYAKSGSCGDKAFWRYYEDTKTLVISGEGKVEVESYDDGPEYKNLPFEKAVVLEGINTLGHYAFAYCESLKEISLPDSLEVIQDRIFDGCKNLTSLTIPKNVNSIGVALFNECYSLTELKVDSENTEFDSRDNCNAVIHTKYNRLIRGIRTTVIPESVCSIGGGAYVCSPGIVEVIIPDTVTELYGQVFMGCWDLETVVLPSSLKEIGDGLFSDLGKLKNITIPDGVELINYCAFQRCVSLENITIPGSVKKVVQSAFSGCSGLKSVTIEDGVEILGGFAFGHCRSLESVVIPKSVKEIGPHAFVNGDSLESITIYNPQCSISDYAQTIPEHTVIYGYEGSTAQEYAEHYVREFVALSDSNSPQEYTASGSCGDNVTWYYYGESKMLIIKGEGKVEAESYDDGAVFRNLPVEKVIVQEGITEIGDCAFGYCESLKEISLPDSLEKLNSDVFYNCKNLTSLTIPKNVNFVGIGLFEGCDSLTELKVAPENTTFDSRENCNGVILTELNCLKLAIKTTTFPQSVTMIAGGAYTGAPGIVEVVLPDTITELSGAPFVGCRELETVVFSSSLKKIENFGNISTLKNITIPYGVELISFCAFNRCESLDNVTIPGSVKIIGQSAFSDCTSLKNLTIEDGVENLDLAAFSRCTSLETVELPKSVKELGAHAFVDCTSLKSITIYNRECNISDYAETIPENAVIYGYEGSTAQEYAEHYVREFVALPEVEYALGDVDMDGYVSIMDATEIQLYVAQLVQWKSEKCEQLADVDGDSDVSIMDATAIQMKLAGLM